MRILVTGRGMSTRRERRLGNFELDQAKALFAAGHDVVLAALDTRSLRRLRPWKTDVFVMEGVRVYYGVFPIGNPTPGLNRRFSELVAERLWARLSAEGWRPDVIHGHFGSAFCSIAKREGIPFVYTEHFSGRNRLLPRGEAERLKKEYARFDCLLAVSGALQGMIRRNTGAEACIVPNIVDVATFQPRAIPHTGFRFVTAANLVPIKGLDTMLRAFALSGPGEAELTVFGDGPERGKLTSLADSLGIGERVCFRGACPRTALAEEYARSDCFVVSSLAETFGLACAEAMAAGLPVIATRCGGPEDFVSSESGLLTPVGDAEAMAAAMGEMASRRTEFDSKSISRGVRERFSPAVIAQTLTEKYQTLTGETPPEKEKK